MNWSARDMDTYLQQKEYIDTLIIPLVQVETDSEQLKRSASAADFLLHLSTFIENQFKGRMMLMPPFTYTKSVNIGQMAKDISKDLNESSFKHIFYLTTDSSWTSTEIAEQVIWQPPIPLEDMDSKLKQSIIEDQLRQLLPKFTEKWSAQ
jgi:hypothetical protein